VRFLREIRLVYVRSLRPPLRSPASVIVGMAMPLVYLVLFGPLLQATTGGTGRDSWRWFVPGMLVQLTLFSTAYAGFSLLPELRSGVMERLRVSPVSRTALLLGRVLKDVTLLLVQAGLFIGLAVVMGFRASVGGVLLCLLLVALTGIAVGVTSYTLAMKLKFEFALAPVLSAVVVPLMLLSGVLLPMKLGPKWLYDLSRANPLSHVVDAARALTVGSFENRSVLVGSAVAVCLVLLCTFWGARSFAREQA